jgi:hypothetical protein
MTDKAYNTHIQDCKRFNLSTYGAKFNHDTFTLLSNNDKNQLYPLSLQKRTGNNIIKEHLAYRISGAPYSIELDKPFYEDDCLNEYANNIKVNPKQEHYVKQFVSTLYNKNFKSKYGTAYISETKTGVGQIDGCVMIKLLNGKSILLIGLEFKSLNGDSEMNLFTQGGKYMIFDNEVNSGFLTCVKGNVMYHFIYIQD